jgi:hypothetical protein
MRMNLPIIHPFHVNIPNGLDNPRQLETQNISKDATRRIREALFGK